MLLHVPKNFQDLALTKYDIVSVGACWLRVCFHFPHRGSGLSSMGGCYYPGTGGDATACHSTETSTKFYL